MELDKDYKKVMIELGNNYGWSNIDDLPDSYKGLLSDVISAVKKLKLCGVGTSFKECEAPTFTVDLNSKQAQEYRNEQMDKILNAPTKLYLYDGENYIEVKP